MKGRHLQKEQLYRYRKLRTTADRRAFIQRFWSKRDPDPATPENEYRSIFYRRVAEADRSFTESTMPGWKTDRGKVYVLLGPPDETEATRGASSIQPDLILWTYRDPPTHLGLGTNAIIRFARDATGEYRMTNRAFLSTFQSSLGLGFQTQAMLVHSLPDEHRILDDLVAAPESLEGPFRGRAESFHAASGALVVLTLGVDTALLEEDPARRPDPSRLQAMAEIRGGEVVGLLGPNGAGKTTIFYMIVGLLKPNGGKIYLNGEDITSLPMYMRARKGIGYLSQEPSVFRKLTVEENLMAILETLPLTRGERRERVETLLKELALRSLRKQKAYSLSGGELRRVEITRALVLSPSFILLDEPFAGIDPIAVLGIQSIVRQLKSKGIGIIITDHNV